MKEFQKNFSPLDTTWNKLESSLSFFTPVSKPKKSQRPASGRIRNRNISQDISSTIPETRKHSKANLSFTSVIKPQTARRPTHSKANSCSYEQIVSPLTIAEIKAIYEAKCKDLEIQPFCEQESRFFSYCFRHFYDRNFDMMDSGLGFESAKVISRILQNSTEFSYINLGKNVLGDKGCEEIMRGIHKNSCIVHVNFSSNEITYNGIESISEFFNRNENIVSLDISSHKGLHRNRLGVKGGEGVCKILKNSRNLCFLNISGTSLGDDGLNALIKGIFQCKTLLSLNLADNALGYEKIEDLGKSVLNTNILKLDLGNNKIGNDGAESICEMLMGSDNISCNIEILNVSGNLITTRGVSRIFYALTNNQTLQKLDLSNNLFSMGLSNNFNNFLIENSGVKFLNLAGCEIKSQALICLPEAFPRNRSLEELDLSNNKICDNGVEAICIGLIRNQGLKKLNLSYNYIKEKGGKSFANCFKINHSLEELNLRENNINNGAGQLLEDICRKNRNILEINLELNPLALKFVYSIKDTLKKNKNHKKKKLKKTRRI